ncbi:cobalt ABC transporter, permease protein CbiQ [Chthonomonas calidirosea]|uniref:Cobalt ABC transporter, permease protein CbiQ n=1 Tax=Chthonomonas calidirosea (strain DSM 23976 / ICMP 18418 / T49) TaxID=1303518 RepID=S0EZ07_CHTCT|nr:cobalt transporter CbiM [Chthonomonas calidirosea]CCW35363.1 cobalt ABC transporter, permease protein CbiQ [Chthonomonas calidirosea T49]CEK20498.1 cobalt ABC transporter, permease protein CbiQ [Chthonomonas calidirosea]
MHIPDGVISPSTCAVMAATMAPVWVTAGKRVRKEIGLRQTPLLALGAAFSFTVMLFNVPAPGGTTAHPVAGTLLAVMLGPWAACIGVSVALAIQALLFGDGGILAYGANCFTMAFVLPFVGYFVYRLLAGRSPSNSLWRAICAGLGAYCGINAAAAVVGVLLGLQPMLFHTADGRALYFPFGLDISVPAMLAAHLLVAGPAEAIVTTFAVRYLQVAGHPLYNTGDTALERSGVQTRWAIIILLLMVLLSPLGLLANGSAFGEWGAQDIKAQIEHLLRRPGYVPPGMARFEKGYHGLLPDYAQPETGMNIWGYIAAGFLGTAAIAGLLLLAGRLWMRHEEQRQQRSATLLSPSSHSSPLPSWLATNTASSTTIESRALRKGSPFLERTLAELAAGATIALRGEESASRKGFLQQFDPRARLIGLLLLAFLATLQERFLPLLGLTLLALVLTQISQIPLPAFLKRVWLTAPVFVLLVALPSALNIVTPGRPLLVLCHHPFLCLTASGMQGVLLLVLRVGTAVSFAALLPLTTRWRDLLYAMQCLGAPRIFVLVLGMAHRYLTVLMQAADEMFTARKSRQVGRIEHAEGRRFAGRSIGSLFAKTLYLSDEVHAAMIARGFTGRVQVMRTLRWRFADTLFLLAVFLVMGFTFLGGRHF